MSLLEAFLLLSVLPFAVAAWVMLELNRRTTGRTWPAQWDALKQAALKAVRTTRKTWLIFVGLAIAWQLLYAWEPLPSPEQFTAGQATSIDEWRLWGALALVCMVFVAGGSATFKTIQLIALALAPQAPRKD